MTNEEIYQLYLNNPEYRRMINKLAQKKQEKEDKMLQEQADQILFTESDLTPELLEGMANHGIRSINVVSEEDYAASIVDQFLNDWAKNNKDKD